MLKTPWLYGAVCVFAVTAACGVSTPLSPASTTDASSSTAPDGSSLKVSAPSLVSPKDGDTTSTTHPSFAVSAVAGQFSSNLGGLTYEFELDDEAGRAIDRTFKTDPTWDYPGVLNGDTAYQWRVRATLGPATGPWSAMGRFRTPVEIVLTCPDKNNKKSVSDWFFQIAASVGATVNSVQTRTAMIPGFSKCSVSWQNQRRGDTRARFFLPPLQEPNGDSIWYVDTGDEGRPFNLSFRY
jgi:hypothetical protein